MQMAIISDLHLGCGDGADGFGHDPVTFQYFLSFLERNFERIILLGDVWDVLTAPKIWPATAALAACKRAHAELCERFARRPYWYVHGNHDIVSGIVERTPDHLELEADGLRLLFLHGHQHDVLVQHARWLAEAGVWFGGWLLRWRFGKLYRALSRLDDWRSGLSEQTERCSFQRWAVKQAKWRQADIIVTGHTHKPLKRQRDDVMFLNSGTCSEGRYSFVALDTRRAQFDVHTSW